MTSGDTHKFYLPNIRRKLALGIAVYSLTVIGSFAYGMSDNTSNPLIIIIVGGLLLLLLAMLMVWVWWMMLKTYLVISPDGIEHHRPYIQLYARWDEIQRIGEFNYSSKIATTLILGCMSKANPAKCTSGRISSH